MQIVVFKKKKYFILLLITLVLAAVTAGIYLFVNPIINGSTSYPVDKYSDVTDWCTTGTKANSLFVDCKALLINIDDNSCFDVQVITKDKELKDLTVCEKNDNLSYTNDVLQYKKLMPVNMVFTYTKEGILTDYSFNDVSFSRVDDTYIQSIVNEDIAKLVTIDPNTTTIQNSVDFCPRPETLPTYISTGNLADYTSYYKKNLMGDIQYINGYNYNFDDSVIRILFGCTSARLRGLTTLCTSKTLRDIEYLPNDISHLNCEPKWDSVADENDRTLFKGVSLIYDSMYMNIGNNLVSLNSLDRVVDAINSSSNPSANTFCSLLPVYSALVKYDKKFNIDIEYITNSILKNLTFITSGVCLQEMYSYDGIDKAGLYIKNITAQQNELELYTRCNNLNKYLSND